MGGSGPAYGYNEAMRDLTQLRQDLQGTDPELGKEAQRLAQDLQKLNMGQASDSELANRINRQILPELERLELQLRRKLDEKGLGQVRSAGSERVPPGYAESVAEYFRKLSKGK